jgi:hypothetical protein
MADPTLPPLPPPMPVRAQQLEYAYLIQRRPAVVTAIGVMSILVGLASLLASAVGGTVVGGIYTFKKATMNAAAATRRTTVAAPATRPATAPATAQTTLPAADVQGVIAAAQSMSAKTPLNPQQVAALQALLEEPGQTLVLPSNASAPASTYVAGVDIDEKGTAHVVFINVIVSISQQGKVVAQQPTSAIPRNIAAAISGTAIGLAIFESLASGALAVFLIVAGIVTLRQSLGGRRLHMIYVAIKIPLALIAILAGTWLAYGLNKGMNTLALLAASSGPEAFPGVFWATALVLGIGGLAYPIALLFALRSRAANEYYNMITTR